MKIESVRAVLTGHRILNPEMQRSWALVRIETDSGTVGWGEASTNWGHSYPTVFRAVVEDVCSRHLEGRDPLAIRDRVGDLKVALDGYLGWEGLSSQTIGAIEIALWDILGKTLGAPDPPAPRRPGLPDPALRHRYHDVRAVARLARALLRPVRRASASRASRCVSGRAVDEDVELVKLVREHVGPDLLIGVDSYWFHDVDSAIELVTRIAPYRIHFFEEPIPQYQIEGLDRLQHSSPIRVAVGERVYSARAFGELARRDAARVFEPDATLNGGLMSCMEIADIAARSSIEVIPHIGGPTVVGLAANLQWATAARVRLFEFDIERDQPMITSIGENPGLALTDIRDGTLTAPSGPGLGVDLDESELAKHPYVEGETYAELFPEHESGRTAHAGTRDEPG